MLYNTASFPSLDSDLPTRDFIQQTKKIYSSVIKKRSCIKPLIISNKELMLLETVRLRNQTISTPQPHPHTHSS